MTAIVTFVTPKGIGSIHAPTVGAIRIREDVTVPDVTSAAAEDGEVVVVGNSEATMIMVAFGKVPDASAMSSTENTSAGYPVPAGSNSVPFAVKQGDLIDIKATP